MLYCETVKSLNINQKQLKIFVLNVIVAFYWIRLVLPIHFIINYYIIFNWACCVSNNKSWMSVDCDDMCHTIHNQFFILVVVDFMSKIICSYGIGLTKRAVFVLRAKWFWGAVLAKALPILLWPIRSSCLLAIYPVIIFLP